MKKVILTFLSVLLLQTCAFAFESAIKFVQVTDVHFEANKPYKVKVLEETVKDINRLKNLSFVVFTGDNLNNPNPDDLDDFVKIINKLEVPYYIVLGDHDVAKSKNLSKDRYSEIIRENNILWLRRSWNYSFKKKGYKFLIVDGAKEVIPGSVGYYRADTREWLDKQLAKNSKRPVIIFQHYPIMDMKEFGTGKLKTHRTYQPEKYFEILDKYNNVLAVLSGHFHVNAEEMRNGVYHISTPTLLGTPHQYKIIDIISKEGLSPIIYTQLKEVEVE
ncbi:MAG: hypothetical protein E7Z93_01550 [Cyanobacteria bacterium SIG32]|nr:hypothetical protein [Cyanobacteria bacterium SIG32]